MSNRPAMFGRSPPFGVRAPTRIEGSMLHLSSGVALVVEAGLAIFCFLDVLLSPEGAVRWLPRWGWALAILVFPLCGVIGWLCAGRPWRARVRESSDVDVSAARPATAPAAGAAAAAPGPGAVDARSTDASLAEALLAVHEEHERTLRAWESDLRRREAALRPARTATGPASGATPE